MLVIAGQFRIPAEQIPAARALMQQVIEQTLQEAGCIAYSYAEDVCEPGLFRVSEAWESREALTAHFAAPHMAEWAVKRAELGLSGRDISLHEVARSEKV